MAEAKEKDISYIFSPNVRGTCIKFPEIYTLCIQQISAFEITQIKQNQVSFGLHSKAILHM